MRSRRALISLLLALATVTAYRPVFDNDFTNYDDPVYILENGYVRAGLTAEGIRWAFTTGCAGNWHPVTWISHMLDVELYGLNPAGHHLTSLLLHIASAILLFLVLAQMTGSTWRSAFVAAVFALHPLHVESVAWAAERKDTLSTLFWMLVMLSYALWHERRRLRLLIIPLYILGLMAKPMLITLPIVLILMDWWPLERQKTAGWKRLFIEKAPLFVLAAMSSVVTFLAQKGSGAVPSFEQFPLVVRLTNAIVSFVAYILKMFWPTKLAVLYPHPGYSLPIWQIAGSMFVLAAITVLALRVRHTAAYVPVGWLWYIITLLPVIGLVQIGGQGMADRYTYIPLTGILIMVAWGVPDLLTRFAGRERTRLLAIPAAAAALAMIVLTRIQVGYWKNSITLFEHAVKVTKNCYVAHNNLGHALAAEGRIDEAIKHYQKALSIRPNYAKPYNNLGLALASQGRHEEAVAQYEEALRIDPEYARAHVNLGVSLAALGRLDEAATHYREAIRLDPKSAAAHTNLGNVYIRLGRLKDAVKEYDKALRIDPYSAEARCNKGLALAQMGKRAEAASQLKAAVLAKPESARMHNELGITLARQGKSDEALREFKKAIEIDPKMAKAYFNIGSILGSRGDLDGAIANYSKALRIKPDLPEAHYALALAYYFKGRYADAWKEISLCKRYGGKPNPGFLQALSRKMPEP